MDEKEDLGKYSHIRKFIESPEFNDFNVISPRWKQITIMRVMESKTYDQIGHELKRSAPAIRMLFLKAKKRIEFQIGFLSKKGAIYSVFIEECPLSVRAKNVLYHANVLTIDDLCCISTAELASARLFGIGTWKEIFNFLKKLKIANNFSVAKSYKELSNVMIITAELKP